MTARHLSTAELQGGLADVLESPKTCGSLRQIVRRPRADQREALAEGRLSPDAGLEGDSWRKGGSAKYPEVQLTLMNARLIALIAQEEARWALAGDQLFVDLDLSVENLPPGTTLTVGSAVIRISDEPHTGCAKFVSRFGADAMKFVNSPEGRKLRLRGVYAHVVQAGTIRVGDPVCRSGDSQPVR